MNNNIIKEIANTLNIKEKNIEKVLTLLKDGNTIPFIARYRKEQTENLNEIQIKNINDLYIYKENLLQRKQEVIRKIDEKNLLTEELKTKILSCEKLIEVEDLYRPFKEKKETKAAIAIKKGMEPLAKIIMSFPLNKTIEQLAENFKCEEKDTTKKIEGAKYIIEEYIKDNASFRKYIRENILKHGIIKSKIKKDKNLKDDIKKTYEMYYDYSEKVNNIKPHRILAINRGEKENILNVTIEVDKDYILEYMNKRIIKNEKSQVTNFVKECIKDSLNKSILPSEIREIRNILKEIGDKSAIENFSSNVQNLLMTPPFKEITVLGFDPAFRTGCKLAVLDKNGNVLHIDKIYPHEPKNEVEQSKKKVLDLINKYKINVIAIGNGTASRESEKFIANLIKESKKEVKYIIVSEAGASIYSASDLAIKEFPNLDVSERSAISIGRRLQDPLSELVKIDPKGIGVGLYQHDVKEKDLDEALHFTVESIVNNVGVNINTASYSILSYISGLTKPMIDKIINKRNEIGKFKSREEIKNKKIISDKAYEQAIGFLRIKDSLNPLDKTFVHPESYDKVYKLLNILNLDINDIGSSALIEKLNNINLENIKNELNIDKYTLEDIIEQLKKPLLDPREEFDKPLLKDNILDIKDLKIGDDIEGVVRNVVDFGAFIDIGLHNDGLIHISKMTDKYIKHPSEILSVGDIVKCHVIDINLEKEKVSLQLNRN